MNRTKKQQQSIRSHRLRQATVAEILDQTLGKFAQSRPDLWERRAYLLLVGLVYEQLSNIEEISLDELTAFAKILAESRHIPGRTKPPPDETDSGTADSPTASSYSLRLRSTASSRSYSS